MYTLEERDLVLKGFKERFEAEAEGTKVFGSLYEELKGGHVVDARMIISGVHKAVEQTLPEGVEIPKVTFHIFTLMDVTETFVEKFKISIISKEKGDGAFKFQLAFNIGEGVFEELVQGLEEVYVTLVNFAMASENAKIMNEKLGEICRAADVPYTVHVIPEFGTEGNEIAFISDTELVFVAKDEKLFALDELLLFLEEDIDKGIYAETIKNAFDQEVASFAKAQTTPQFVGIKDPLILHLTEINRLLKPITLIKKVNTKKLEKVTSKKDTFAHYMQDRVYAVVFCSDGSREVVLSPFDMDTLEASDVQVI